MKLYTGTGDTGRASTRTRMNIPKSSPVFELLGTLDEFTSTLGIARQKTPAALAEILAHVQENADALSKELAGGERFATKEQVMKLEQAIDSLASSLPEGASAQAGASEGGAALELARAVARKAERRAVAMAQTGGVPREVLAWLNRLSALLAALARVCDLGQPATTKTPPPYRRPVPPVKASVSRRWSCAVRCRRMPDSRGCGW